MDTLPTPILTLPTTSITIRPYHPTDAASLAHHANDRKIWDNLRNRMPHPYLEPQAQDWIAHCNDPATCIPRGPYPPSQSQTPPVSLPTHFAITLTSTAEAIGSIGLDFGDARDVYARSAELGYWLGAAHWGKGIMGGQDGVVPAFVVWAWRTFGRLERLNAEVDAANAASARCLELAGFRVEGRRERGFVKNGFFRDAVLMGMLRPEGVGSGG